MTQVGTDIMTMKMQELDEGRLARWDELVGGFERATVFHTASWLHTLVDVLKVDFRPYGIFDDGELVGLFPLFFARKAMMRLCVSPLSGWVTPYLGPLVDQDRLGDVMGLFSALAAETGVDYSEVTIRDRVDPGPMERAGFSVEERTTYILSLASDDEMWSGFDPGCRRAIRKAERAGLEVVDGDLTAEIDRYYEMVTDVYAKWRRPPPMPREFYLAMVANMGDRLKILFVRHGGRVIAGGIFPVYGDTVYYIDGASDSECLGLRPNNLLQWSLIRWASRNGLAAYDMIGADIPSIARFKAGFGPRLSSYTYAHLSRTRIASWGRALYKKGAPTVRALRRQFSAAR